MITKIYHININSDTGEINHGIIEDEWTNTKNTVHIIRALQNILIIPNSKYPVDNILASQLK